MVAARWRALVQAARWNGNAPQTTTGEARVSASHCQFLNCSAGIIDIATTGRVRIAQISSRLRSESASPASGAGSSGWSTFSGGGGAVAV